MSGPLSLQWNLDTTVGSTINVATGLIKAATSDNVQPLAITACEAFGAKLAVSQEVRLKMETLAKRKHTTYVFSYIKACVGFAAGDCADYLASSEAGVRLT